MQTDIREIDLGRERFDIVVAAAVLHHLRTDDEWRAVFAAIHAALRPGGSFWIFDMIESTLGPVEGADAKAYGDIWPDSKTKRIAITCSRTSSKKTRRGR